MSLTTIENQKIQRKQCPSLTPAAHRLKAFNRHPYSHMTYYLVSHWLAQHQALKSRSISFLFDKTIFLEKVSLWENKMSCKAFFTIFVVFFLNLAFVSGCEPELFQNDICGYSDKNTFVCLYTSEEVCEKSIIYEHQDCIFPLIKIRGKLCTKLYLFLRTVEYSHLILTEDSCPRDLINCK